MRKANALIPERRTVVKVQEKPAVKNHTILLVDDHELVRYGMKLMVEALGCTVLEAGSGEKSIDVVRSNQIDLVFMDIALPGMDGITASTELLKVDRNLGIIILTGLRISAVPKGVLQSGVKGFITKNSAAGEIEQAISRVLGGEMYLSPSIARQLALSSFQASDGEGSPFAALSQREIQVVLLLLSGYRNGDAGESLYLSAKTVSTYKSRAFKKLGITNTAELVKLAMCWGFVEP